MRYVLRQGHGSFDLARYEDYLDEHRALLQARIVGPELLTLDRFVPTGPGSFHDARFESLSVSSEPPAAPRDTRRLLRAELRLKGPYFDRYFELQYEGVDVCKVEAPGPQDDLLMHELRMEGSLLIHELLFDHGKAIEVSFQRLRFAETLSEPG